MGRWKNDARGRLEQAALALYQERGFEQTPVADIAARAGLTERTYFRHFADKREVLFGGSKELQERLVRGVAEAAPHLSPLEVVTAALETIQFFVPERREHARQRQRLLETNPELQERELMKLAALSGAAAEALRSRGVAEPAASLAADAGMAVFRAAFGHWIDDNDVQEFGHHVQQALEELRAVLLRP
ncbi:TetR family transcriptional regulator [Deinococcus sp. Arct2-2]|uniref:TetR/AcrR family transcriptional regulator n=1 Tax=Deinococcus sp. Arct2-2 TaxID=2568653 RepID=UPI0010A5920F|nr:TetR/AcrR family transcriptional regulator [Deinococcus sp. Arct2-2]THF70832.1 TetR family transcriptional regulator [Deinococcus sp. Arct2-2]